MPPKKSTRRKIVRRKPTARKQTGGSAWDDAQHPPHTGGVPLRGSRSVFHSTMRALSGLMGGRKKSTKRRRKQTGGFFNPFNILGL